MSQILGTVDGRGRRVALICSRFNEVITQSLLRGAREALVRHGVSTDNITEIWVPGALELGVIAKIAAGSGAFDGVVVMGAVIRGDTAHFDVVVSESATQCSRVGFDFEVAVTNAILTTDTMDQAIDRAGGKAGNKGAEAALSMLEMIDLIAKVKKGS